MKNIKSNVVNLFMTLLLITTFTSCDEVGDGDLDAGSTSVVEFAGDWWVIALESDGITPAYGGNYVQFTTYNTAADDGTMWIDDNNIFFQIKTRVSTNTSNLTFSGDVNSSELYTEGTVTVSNGKVTKGSYTTSSNTVVDEIYFEAEFDWDPGTIYKFKGHKRTGFLEDENPNY
ncbi:lipid-binding protein [Lutibacter maritimus]|uniref:Lipid-binding putative hydrolase n=1 Tax=Lutibacter maritimus TaxID=593133 RepID=A0A1I6RZB7_9FLAO|nr:lipid-binding protein [Lutibacter maritimus]SFS69838.1 Lipid-binding putative hydrolase [Lutibacter maritimus]